MASIEEIPDGPADSLIVPFDKLIKSTCLLDLRTYLRLGALIEMQDVDKISPLNFVLEWCLLADTSDDVKLYQMVLETFCGDSKPVEEKIQIGNWMSPGTIYCQSQACLLKKTICKLK